MMTTYWWSVVVIALVGGVIAFVTNVGISFLSLFITSAIVTVMVCRKLYPSYYYDEFVELDDSWESECDAELVMKGRFARGEISSEKYTEVMARL